MRNRLLFVAAASIVGACASPSLPPASPFATPYHATGIDTRWSLDISHDRIRFDDGRAGFDVPTPPARRNAGGTRYETDRIIIDIRHRRCTDPATGHAYRDTVRAVVGGRTLIGCGMATRNEGAAMTAVGDLMLNDTHWVVATLDGAKPDAARPPSLDFSSERISGFSGCNRFSGPYALDGATLTPGAIVSTRMACIGDGGATERAYMALLTGPISITRTDRDRLRLTGNGHSAELTQAMD